MHGNLKTVTPIKPNSKSWTYTSNIQYVARNIHYHSKREEREYCNKITPKASWRNTILCIFIMMSKYSSNLQLFSALLTTTHFYLFGLAPHKSTALFGRNPTALSSPTSWALQANSGFMKWPLWASIQDTPDMCLTSAAVLSHSSSNHTQHHYLPCSYQCGQLSSA